MTKYSVTYTKNIPYYLVRGGASAHFGPGADFSAVMPWKGMRRCNIGDDGVVNAYYGESDYDDTGGNGQVVVEVPLFYSEVTLGTDSGWGTVKWTVSDDEDDDLDPHPMFVVGQLVKDHIYIGAFLASRTGEGTHESAYKLESKASTIAAPVRPHADTPQHLAEYAIARTYPPQTVNLLSDEQANGAENGVMWGVYDVWGGSGITVEPSTLSTANWPFQSTHSVKLTLPTPAVSGGAIVPYIMPRLPHVGVGTYTFSVYAYAPDNPTCRFCIIINERDDAEALLVSHESAAFTITDTPTRFSYTVTFTDPTATKCNFRIAAPWAEPQAGVSVYFDGFQLEEYTEGHELVAPSGYPTAWHTSSTVWLPLRPASKWGLLTYQAWAGIQLLSLVEHAWWASPGWIGLSQGLIKSAAPLWQDPLGSSPSPTNLAYNGYTGSYGVQMGNQSGCVYAPLLEMYATPPTGVTFPSVPSYRGFEHPWGHIGCVTDGAVVKEVDGDYHLFLTDDGFNFDATGYTDSGIVLGTTAGSLASGMITDWQFGTSVKWPFMPTATTGWGVQRIMEWFDVVSSWMAQYPCPIVVGSFYSNYNTTMLSSQMGGPVTNQYAARFGTRIQYTPEG